MTVASTNAIKLPQNGPGAPQSANKGAETRGKYRTTKETERRK